MSALSARLTSIGLLFDVINGLADGLDLVSLPVWDQNGELVFKLHEHLDGVEGVEAEILVERGRVLDSGGGRRAGVRTQKVFHTRCNNWSGQGWGVGVESHLLGNTAKSEH